MNTSEIMSRYFHVEKYTLPIVAPLEVREEWQVSVSAGDDPEFIFHRTRQPAYRTEDSFEVRRAFLAVKSVEDSIAFFDRYGPLQYKVATDVTTKKDRSLKPEHFKWSQFCSVQADFEMALLADGIPIEKAQLYHFVFGQPLTIELRFRAAQPDVKIRGERTREIDDAAIAPCFDVIDALRATIFLSRRQGFRWSRCARPDCPELFEQTTKHRRLYCSPTCAHLQAVRTYNANAKKKAAKKSLRAGNKRAPKKGR